MPDISKLGLPAEVRPHWFDRGLPVCDETCPSWDGKRCAAMGSRPRHGCEPAVEAMAQAIPGFLEEK